MAFYRASIHVLGLLAVLLAAANGAFAQEQARGVVFHDVNGDGLRQGDEPGLPGVGVSNGREVVQSGDDGAWTLPVTVNTTVFLIKPGGWMTPLDELNLPRFYYVHNPAGSPPMRFPGVAPTGPLPDSIDFALTPRPEPERFETIMFGDTQPRNQEEVDYIAHDVVEELVGFDAAFGFTLGDVVFDDLAVFEPLNRVIAHIGVPWYNVHGNHDTNQDVPGDRLSDDTWTRLYGPNYYAFDYGPVHFLVLDNIAWDGDGYHGEFGPDQLAFVKNDLAHVAKDRLVVAMMHIPIVNVDDRAALFALLADYENSLTLSAHWHRTRGYFLDNALGWPGPFPHHHVVATTACGSWWSGMKDEQGIPHTTMADGAPNGYTILSFEGNRYSMRFKAARRPADHQMTVYTPEVVPADQLAQTEVLANVFAGDERSKVSMRVGKTGAWVAMTPVEREDAYYLEAFDREAGLPDDLRRRLPKPAKTTHLWSAPLPEGLAPGAHLIEVRTVDLYGQTWEGRRIFRVE